MVEFGAVNCEDPTQTFHAKLKPISDNWVPEALAVTGYTREQTATWDDPVTVMHDFKRWLEEQCGNKRPMFISDNNGFDWQFINYYFWKFCKINPFGHSSTNLGSLYKGTQRNMRVNFKHLRKTAHTHNPVDDAMGNVEAFNVIRKGFKA